MFILLPPAGIDFLRKSKDGIIDVDFFGEPLQLKPFEYLDQLLFFDDTFIETDDVPIRLVMNFNRIHRKISFLNCKREE